MTFGHQKFTFLFLCFITSLIVLHAQPNGGQLGGRPNGRRGRPKGVSKYTKLELYIMKYFLGRRSLMADHYLLLPTSGYSILFQFFGKKGISPLFLKRTSDIPLLVLKGTSDIFLKVFYS